MGLHPDIVGAALFTTASAIMIYGAHRKNSMLPNAAEQAWLDAQLATPPGQKLSADEQKWLDQQVQDVEDSEMLDDARQAGACAPRPPEPAHRHLTRRHPPPSCVRSLPPGRDEPQKGQVRTFGGRPAARATQRCPRVSV